MQISVTGQQIEVGTALQEHVEEHVERAVSKYFEEAVHANVVFSRESHLVTTDIQVNEGTKRGMRIIGNGDGGDAYVAFDKALERVSKQLRRYKRKLKNHHHGAVSDMVPETTELLTGKQYVLAFDTDIEEEAVDDVPLIIAESPMEIPHLTVSEAVMQMDLANLSTLMFVDRKNNHVSVVYRRDDGNIGWVDSHQPFSQAST